MTLKFGPAGLGPLKAAQQTLKLYSKLGIKLCEIAFTYGVYIKSKPDALRIAKTAKKLKIELSIHAPYWINLNSADKEKIQKSKQRILRCCEIGHYLKAKQVVFHPGYYGKTDKKQTYENIKNEILNLKKQIKKNNWEIKLAPETTGKVNVFGSAKEISQLVTDTQCSFCIDFAHLLARYKKIDFEKLKKLFPQKNWHCHFSGIEFTEKGEKRHKLTNENELKNLLKKLPKNKDITIINESPSPLEDSLLALKIADDKSYVQTLRDF